VPVILLIVFGLVAVVALGLVISALPAFLAVRRFHRANVLPVRALAVGSEATVRGTVIAARRAAPYPRLTAGDVVFSTLEVFEHIGRGQRVAFRGRNAQLFTLRDDEGGTIDVDPDGTTLADAHITVAKGEATRPAFRSYLEQSGTYRWERTPTTCWERAIKVGDVISARGQIITPFAGQREDEDTALRLLAQKISLYASSPWRGAVGREIAIGLVAAALSAPAAVACAVWAKLL